MDVDTPCDVEPTTSDAHAHQITALTVVLARSELSIDATCTRLETSAERAAPSDAAA